jgi:F420-0:gamma-glutamyl ligase-like protein
MRVFCLISILGSKVTSVGEALSGIGQQEGVCGRFIGHFADRQGKSILALGFSTVQGRF